MQNLYLLPNAEEEIIDSYDEDIIVTSRDGKIIKVTQISGCNYDLPAKDLLGQSVYELEEKGIFSPAITPLVLKQKKKVVIVQTTTNGKKVLITGIPLFNEINEVEFVISYSYEVSELFTLQEYLNELEGEMSAVKGELALLREESLTVKGIISESKSMKQILKTVNKIAPLNVAVTIQGEIGVGKSTIAKLIHKQSLRQNGPFIEVNCATIPDAIFENELVGGAKTGTPEKIGFLQMAQSGTLYLQGVDELSLASQTILLKSLQQTNGNFRIVSSTERGLDDLTANKRFREDLFYFLHVVPIHIKPLRERLEDLSKIIEKYVDRYTAAYQVNKILSDSLFHELLHMEWGGNHLEIKNVVERLIVQNETDIITNDDLPVEYRRNDSGLDTFVIDGRTLPAILDKVEEKVLLSAQKRYKTTIEMAKVLGISQPSVVRKLKKYANK
ncbi:Fis family transcriptional regulator [Virgibacillus phasianinus]|uniref:Fis family transcriptional regulator n=1 Tax=Virgibacillus phasianinus TaxID=2017483 RepID=A0A220U1G4_9BACI|nr:sigma 54-interacting transcriptional regulator [Virgibacillus phasianinus]ASK61885.1 Fis family transcriptional regulator [Virgibacillus phasianinus]